MQPILNVTKLTKTFNTYEDALKGIDLSIFPCSFTAILGPSGCGKTTLLNILSGLMKPTSGDILWCTQNITHFSAYQLADWKRHFIGHIFQNHLLLNNLTVKENIEIGINPSSSSIPLDYLAKILGLTPFLHKFPSQLSSGEQQRVGIARAVIKKPKIIFCDEATGALDEANSKEVITLLHELKTQYNIAILFVTHNPQIAKTADRIITLKDGLIEEDKPNTNPISADEMIWG